MEAVANHVAPRTEGRRDLLIESLSEIARAVAETLDLSEVFNRVAETVKRIVPADWLVVSLFEGDDAIVIYALVGPVTSKDAGRRLSKNEDYSPGLWAVLNEPGVTGDLAIHLDPRFTRDREFATSGLASMLRVPLMHGETRLGFLSAVSVRKSTFDAEHEALLQPVADLVAMAVEHARLAGAERQRRQRREVLEKLVPTLATALDVREVFDQVSAIAQEVLPHDRMSIGLLREDHRAVRIFALSGEPVPDLPEEIPLPEPDVARLDFEFEIVLDTRKELDPKTEKCQILLREGIRSMLRVPIYLEGKIAGGLTFFSKSPGQFAEADVDIARRVADQMALALSHQRLAEEARRTAEAREKAIKLEARVEDLTRELESRDGFARIVGRAKSWRDVLVQAAKVATTETTVLLTGESGTGKEVIARAIHRASPRAHGPFVAINCAALPDQLLESELFGYERGAFTGATSPKPGRLEQAQGGVLFLDEAGEMSPVVQAKLLRLLQEREFQRLGGTKVLKADVRIIAATNRDLGTAIKRGEFREDLYYRLHVFEIRLPPLRERMDDILPLTESFLAELGLAVGPAAGISREARELLLSYPWPGNVRELKNALERATILCEGGLITAAHLPISVSQREPGAPRPVSPGAIPPGGFPPQGVDLDAMERSYVEQALKQASGNKSRAAKLLGLTRAQLYSRLEKYGITAS